MRKQKIHFDLTAGHLALLKAMAESLGWDDDYEFGAPVFDAKRPYGNSMLIERDVARILDVKPAGEDGELTDGQCQEMVEIHRETFTALLVLIATGQSTPGRYVATRGGAGGIERRPMNWKPERKKEER